MRAGLCALPQALTVQAASIVKQAVNLAKRRGHSQVTPLHVASAMLACPTGLLRRACTHHSHSHHPLQWKALELCFSVALNRLPASTITNPLLGPHHHHFPRPSLSNALVAAFKRAQAHQRRGSIENQQQQQQPILALKIEVEQLVISILDDPSVSRVMREAGFSSSQVKIKVEENVPLDICSQSPNKSLGQAGVSDDVMSVLNALISKKRNTVIVGGCLAATEGVIRGIIDRFERGQVPGDLRYAQFISLPLLSFRNQSKAEVEKKLVELRYHMKSYMGRGIVLYLGDLKWVAEFWAAYYGGDGQKRNNNYYCVEEYIIMEIKRLVFEIGENERVWIMGMADFQIYTRCKAGHPSLENIWKLHPFTIPVGSLSLSLYLDSDSPPTHQFITTNKVQRDGLISWPLLESGADRLDQLTCSSNFSVNYFNGEGQSMATSSIQKKKSAVAAAKSTLPSWLQQYKEESRRNCDMVNDNQDLCEKWNSFGNKQTHFNSSSPSSISVSSQECKQLLPKEHQFWVCEGYESSLRNSQHPKPDLLSNPNSSPNSASSSEAEEEEEDSDCLNSFNKFTDENLKILSDALERKVVVPWQKEIIPEIARTILECRSKKEQTWLLFLGADDHNHGKEKIAREIAKVVFGSHSNNFTNFSPSQSRQDDCRIKKRSRDDELGFCSYIERFVLALNENPHRVFFMEDLGYHKVDSCYCQKGFKQAIESGSIALADGEIVPLKDSIIIFSCDNLDSVATACSHQNKRAKSEEKDDDCNLSLDLNIAIEDEEDHSVGDFRNILESVDKQIIFQDATTVIGWGDKLTDLSMHMETN